MKEATGELSTTAIAIVAIGLVLAIFTVILLPMIRQQIALNQACNSGPGYTIKEDSYTIVCGEAGGVNNIGKRSWECTYLQDGGRSAKKTCQD